MTTDTITTDIATYDPTSGSQGVVIGGHIDGFIEFAKKLALSDLLPKGLKGNAPNVFMALMQGLDLGLRPMQALNLVDVIEGKPSMKAEGKRALILAAGHDLKIEQKPDRCIIHGHRKEWPDGEWRSAEFTVEDAKTAKLTAKDNWQKYQADMLLARATSRLARAYFADVTNGLATTEELLDITVGASRPTLAQVAQQRDTPNAEQPEADRQTGEIVDAEVIPEPTDDEIRQAVLDAAKRDGSGPNDDDNPVHYSDAEIAESQGTLE